MTALRDPLVMKIASWVLEYEQLNAITDQEIFHLIDKAVDQLKMLPALIYVDIPVAIFGDIHGHFPDLIEFLKMDQIMPGLKILDKPQMSLLFLGDYVDRGDMSLEVIVLVVCLKLLFPTKIHLLRGNHESSDLNLRYSFYRECMSKRNGNFQIWKRWNDLFKELPVCALVSGHIFCMHGGLPRMEKWAWSEFTELSKPRTLLECYDAKIVGDLLWADSTNNSKKGGDWKKGEYADFWDNKARQTSIEFNDIYIKQFMGHFPHIKLIVRAHHQEPKGHRINEAGNLHTVFSAPRYEDPADFGSIMLVYQGDKTCEFNVEFITIRPMNPQAIATENGELDREPATPRVHLRSPKE